MASRGWAWTLFHEGENWDGPLALCRDLINKPGVRYVSFGAELCPDTGRKHLQGQIEFEKRGRRLKGVLKLFEPYKPHCEQRRGTAEELRDYNKKDGIFEEFGDCPGAGDSGERSGFAQFAAKIAEGVNPRTIAGDFPGEYMRYARGAHSLYSAVSETRRREPTHVAWLYGPTGTGKSRCAWDTDFDATYCKPPQHKWWDGYDQACHKIVILDDLRPEHFRFAFFLNLFDRYPLQVETKGGTRQFNSKLVICTSCHEPERFANVCQSGSSALSEDVDQFMRRLTLVARFGAGGKCFVKQKGDPDTEEMDAAELPSILQQLLED